MVTGSPPALFSSAAIRSSRPSSASVADQSEVSSSLPGRSRRTRSRSGTTSATEVCACVAATSGMKVRARPPTLAPGGVVAERVHPDPVDARVRAGERQVLGPQGDPERRASGPGARSPIGGELADLGEPVADLGRRVRRGRRGELVAVGHRRAR